MTNHRLSTLSSPNGLWPTCPGPLRGWALLYFVIHLETLKMPLSHLLQGDKLCPRKVLDKEVG